ncbi:MAG: peptide chain release factor N(5)-glutamine methyltransferase [Magnetococcales bacterium]|nr:peptide chain release factor N(5)-glutamine methyltransferase [Magnetococcales bacterium]MBF0438557.1 peptide chain release factor N(5)-glutamine methyltransferase [Magnetococcales bacterium]
MTASPLWTIRTLLGWSTPWLAQRGISSSRLDSELLLAKALQCRRIDLFLDPHRFLTAAELAEFKVLVKRRAAREPLAHIVGLREFWSIEFFASAEALIPRPETELLVETIVAHYSDHQAPLEILEPCVGSGAVLCALLTEYPQARGVGTDLSWQALELARRNAEKVACQDRMVLMQGDLDAPLPASALFDVIIANPPYIVSEDLAGLQPEVRDWEPHLALDGGVDGLQIVSRIPAIAKARLQSGGLVVTEIAHDQGQAVLALFQQAGFSQVEILNDYTRTNRAVKAVRIIH